MERCSCDTSYYSEEANRDTWKWGGCGDNLKYSQKFVERFLMPKKGDLPRSRDVRAKIDRHNANLGIRVSFTRASLTYSIMRRPNFTRF